MSRVEINADGRHVIVDHVGDLPYLLEKALATWQATERAKPARGFELSREQACTCGIAGQPVNPRSTCLVHRDPPQAP